MSAKFANPKTQAQNTWAPWLIGACEIGSPRRHSVAKCSSAPIVSGADLSVNTHIATASPMIDKTVPLPYINSGNPLNILHSGALSGPQCSTLADSHRRFRIRNSPQSTSMAAAVTRNGH